MNGKPAASPQRVAVAQALARYRVTTGIDFKLDAYASDHLPNGLQKCDAEPMLAADIARLGALQERLYADASQSLLVVLQAMDAGGKDSTIKSVMSGVNPQGVTITSFKAPGPHELAHGFLWRISRALPARGQIGIFNRSHYEDVLVARVHPELLTHQPPELTQTKAFWDDRLADIANFEAYLERQGTRVVKFFLDVSRDEQKKRLLARLDTPGKEWKFDVGDIRERALWSKYRDAYAQAIAGTATASAPWYVIPADHKWSMRVCVAAAMVEALEGLDLPAPSAHASPEVLRAARKALTGD